MAKTPISIRVDAELLAWFKQMAPNGYQVMIQDVLREYQQKQVQRTQIILGRAQQIFLQYHSKCFWHLRIDLEITSENLSIVRDGLRKYGGLAGLHLSTELEIR
jgi:hypothetical protein